MARHTLLNVLALASILQACTEERATSIVTPASENACNVACAIDHAENADCFENPSVVDYSANKLLPSLFAAAGPIVAKMPRGACYCGVAVLDNDGKITTMTTIVSTDAAMESEIRSAVLAIDAVAVPLGAECIVGRDFPLSLNN
jgi:hypothetical protein